MINDKVYCGGFLDYGNPRWVAVIWEDGKVKKIFNDNRNSIVSAIGILDGKLAVTGWCDINGIANPFIMKNGEIQYIDNSTNEIYAWGAYIKDNTWAIAGVEEAPGEKILWLYTPEGKKELHRQSDNMLIIKLLENHGNIIVVGSTGNVPFLASKNEVVPFQQPPSKIEYSMFNDAIMVDGKVVVVGNISYANEGGFGQLTIWLENQIIRFNADGFANKVLLRE